MRSPESPVSSDPIPAGCLQQSVLDSTACANYSNTGDALYARYGYSCGHDIEATAQDSSTASRSVGAAASPRSDYQQCFGRTLI
jgi:hypothetical protein